MKDPLNELQVSCPTPSEDRDGIQIHNHIQKIVFKTLFINLVNIMGALFNLDDITNYSNDPSFVLNVIFY